jgi:arylsulfatase A-like enzyme
MKLHASLAAAVAAATLVVPPAAFPHAADGAAPIAPNAVGTWRLDSLLDQARVSGMSPSDVDPATFVLHDLRFDAGVDGVKALPVPPPFGGKSEVTQGEGCAHLVAKGAGGVFTIAIPHGDDGQPLGGDRVGMVAVSVRSSDASEVVVTRDALPGGGLTMNVGGVQVAIGPGGIGGGGAQPPPQLPGGLQLPPGPPPAGGGPPNGPPPNGGGAGPRPPQGAAMAAFDPRQLLGGSVMKLATDGAWHTLARTKEQLALNTGNRGLQMGAPPAQPLEQVTLIVLVPKGKEESGVSLDLQFLHVLDAKADYAAKTTAPCSIKRDQVIHGGMWLNTPAEVSWTLVAPPKARLLAGLTALDRRPFDFLVHVAANGTRKTVVKTSHAGSEAIDSIDVDLSSYAGQTITLTVEAVEQDVPTVAFLLQPVVFGTRPKDVRNVFLYFCDTTRADALSCYGNPRPTTPNLDAIAGDGVRFERCFSQGAWTYVSMPASLSGMFPSVNGIKNGGERLADSVVTVADAFRAAGYLTAAFIRNDFVGETTNTQKGFDFFFPGPSILPNEPDKSRPPAQNVGLMNMVNRALGRGPAVGGNDAAILGGNVDIFGSGSSRDLYAKASPWLEKYCDVPFFLYLHAVDPHEPYDPEKADMNRFLSDDERKQYDDEENKLTQSRMQPPPQATPNVVAAANPNAPPAADPNAKANPSPATTPTPANGPAPNGPTAATPPAPGNGAAAPNPAAAPIAGSQIAGLLAGPARGAVMNAIGGIREQMRGAGFDPDQHVAKARALYDAEVVYFDRHMERMVDLMKKKGLWDDLVFSFNADHGEEFLEHGGLSHGQSVYAELDHVPWILRAPGLPKGKVVTDSVMNLDVGPTLLGLCGIKAPETFQGRNLREPLSDNEECPTDPIFTERWGGGIGFGGNFNGTTGDGDDQFVGQWAVIEGPWKTVVTREMRPQLDDAGKPKKAADGKELPPAMHVELAIFDLRKDMRDEHSLLEQERPRAEAAAQRLLVWLREMKKLNARYSNENTTNDDAAAKLRALGYAQ